MKNCKMIGREVKVVYKSDDAIKMCSGVLIDWLDNFAFIEDKKIGMIGIPLTAIMRINTHYRGGNRFVLDEERA